MSKTALFIHVVFATKRRERTIRSENKERLYSYISGLLRNKNCFVYAINGVEDHLHLLFDLHPTVALSSLIKELKISTNQWVKDTWIFPDFCGWCNGYYAGSISPSHKKDCIAYIQGQEAHHLNSSFIGEMQNMAKKYGMTFHDDDWE